MGKVLTVIKSRWFITLIGLLLLSLLVWFGGPYLGLGDSQPLASPISRLVFIIVLLAIWIAWLLFQQVRQNAKTRQMASDLAGQDASSAGSGDDRSVAERATLQQRFQEAVDTLRKTRKGGRNLYELPWYVVIGPPGSGKSTLLLNSGLNFPLSNKFGKEALRGIGGTRNCDWWFTDEAVFLDTAGRYTTQDSDRGADASAWAEFLKLLRRYRKRRPINGVIVAMSLSDLLVLDEAGRQAHILAVRARLEELAKHLRIGAPAYLVFTKADLVAGFTEFFDDLNPSLRSQVLGMSFPAEKTLDGSAAKSFGEEFDLLMTQITSRVIERLHAERDRGRRAAILSFPQQLGSLRETLRGFVEGVFAGHGYGSPLLLLRGAYLTSGTQEGTPIDRMMGAVARTFGLEAARVRPPGTQTRTFFVERLLREVLFRESGFAGTDPKLERQKILLQIGAYAGMIAVTVLLILGLITSYHRNGGYLDEVQAALAKYQSKDGLAVAGSRPAYFVLVLKRLEALGGAVDVADQHRGNVPWLMRFGLYQGSAVGDEVRQAYDREMNAILLPGLAAQFRSGLMANAEKPQALYYYLKGYLMLGEPEHAKAAELEALATAEWRQLFPDAPVLQDAMAKHLSALLDERGRLRAQPIDKTVVEQARNTLRTADLATLVYGSLKLGAEGLPGGLHLDTALGLLGNVFERKSGAALSQPIPALYTQPVFRGEVTDGIEKAVKQFADDDWVFGAQKMDDLTRATVAHQVLGLYEQDYIQTWDGLLSDLQLKPVANIQEASATAAKLAGPNSPLKLFLKVLRDNTADMMHDPSAGPGNAAADAAKAVAETEAKRKAMQTEMASALSRAGVGMPSAQPAEKPGGVISSHFEQLNKLTEGAPGTQPIDQTIKVLDDLSKTLLTMTDFSNSAGQPNPQLMLAQQQAGQLPPPVSTWVASLTGKSAALAASGAKGAMGDQFQQMVAKDCATFTRNRYPFAPNSSSEIPLQNFGELFGDGGSFDQFYKNTLSKLVDASGSRWRWKTGPGAVAGSNAMLAQVEAADHIRQMFFRGGQKPEVDFTLLTPVLDPAIARLSVVIDGQKFDYTPGSPANVSMKWPGPQPGRVTIAGYDASGNVLAKFDYSGDWAFFRALQFARLKQVSEVRFSAVFDFGGHQATLNIQADNLKNPFLKRDLQNFRCG